MTETPKTALLVLSLDQPLGGPCCALNTKVSCGSRDGDRRGVRVDPAVWGSGPRSGFPMGAAQDEGRIRPPFTLQSSDFCIELRVKTAALSFSSFHPPD